MPAGVPHTSSTERSAGATILEVDLGRALDGYLRELQAVIGSGPVDPAAVAEVMSRHDTRSLL